MPVTSAQDLRLPNGPPKGLPLDSHLDRPPDSHPAHPPRPPTRTTEGWAAGRPEWAAGPWATQEGRGGATVSKAKVGSVLPHRDVTFCFRYSRCTARGRELYICPASRLMSPPCRYNLSFIFCDTFSKGYLAQNYDGQAAVFIPANHTAATGDHLKCGCGTLAPGP